MKDYSQDRTLDDIDRKLLQELQHNSRTSNVDLAAKVQLSPPAVHSRIKRLEQDGYISSYTAILDRAKVGYDMVCFVNVTLQGHDKRNVDHFRDSIDAIPEVLECHFVTGEYDYILKVVVRNRRHLEEFMTDKLTPIGGIARINTCLVLSEIKNTTVVSLEDD